MLPHTNPPKSLCPYFWILVGLIVTSPIVLLISTIEKVSSFIKSKLPKRKLNTNSPKPVKTFEQIEAEWDAARLKEKKKEAFFEKIGKVFGKIFVYVIFPVISISGIAVLIYKANKVGWLETLIILGILIGFILFIFGIVWLGNLFFDKYFDTLVRYIGKFFRFIFKPFRLIGLMIKAIYEKACPLVDWVEPVNK